jgi:hypothetical protein
LSAGTAFAGTWRATVPIAVPVAPGGALRFDVVAMDGAGNASETSRVVDTDGIPAVMDRSRDGSQEQVEFFSSQFNHNGVTAGKVARNTWTTTLSPFADGKIRARVTGNGTVARIGVCEGSVKEVWLDSKGETADIKCVGPTVHVRAISTLGTITVLKQQANNTWTAALLRPGAPEYSTGSPATASSTNTEPIDVLVLQGPSVERARVVGSFRLAPGDSVDVAVVPAVRGGPAQLRLTALRGTVAMTMSGVAGALVPGRVSTFSIDQTPPRVTCGAPDGTWHGDNVRIACVAEDASSGLSDNADARFTVATSVADEAESADAVTEPREVCDAVGNCVSGGVIRGNMVDRRAPSITFSGLEQGRAYLLHQFLPADFRCEDGGAGVSTCEGTTALAQAVPTDVVGTGSLAVTASDAVGNTRTAAIQYLVTYAIEPLADSLEGLRGRPLEIALRIADVQEVNRSSRQIVLTAVAITAEATGARYELNAAPFEFDETRQAYTLTLDTVDLDAGDHILSFGVSGDPLEHSVVVRVK